MAFETILFEVRDQIAWVTMNRPESMNAINRLMARELVEACKQVEDDAGIRVAIFTGAGERAFSAGMDLKERAETSFSPIERRNQKLSQTIHTQSRAIGALTKPTIAAILGYCVGGGLEMALACDMRVAAEDAKLGLTEVRRGLIPGAGGTQRLPRLVGEAKAKELMYIGDPISAEEAYRIGLANRLVPAGEALTAARQMGQTIASRAGVALRYIQQAVDRGLNTTLEEGLHIEADLFAKVFQTEDVREGVEAFINKRQPNFRHR